MAEESTLGNGAPHTTKWRRQKLMSIGSSQSLGQLQVPSRGLLTPSSEPASPDESSHLLSQSDMYGTVPASRSGGGSGSRRWKDGLKLRLSRTLSVPGSPTSAFRKFGTLRQRPISAYDQPLGKDQSGRAELDFDAKTNGIRVWYSSFSSVDWLHDAIKDSARFARLRRRKSVRAQMRLAYDRSLGWIIVTVVGILTAIVAYLVIKSEQWLFDIKEGYCETAWYLSKQFCCPGRDVVETCPAWTEWADVLDKGGNELERGFVEYIPYTVIALTLALVSCLLTLNLTKSTTFSTRKDSGVLSNDFVDEADGTLKPAEPKRKIMYYAAGSGIPEIKTILSGFVIHGFLGGRTLFTKATGLSLSVASGLSLGKEGPFVHIGSCIGNIVSRMFSKYENNEGKRREILSAAAAAGVSVAFGAPIGGTLFSLEEVSFFFPSKVMGRSFFCAMVAAITLRILNPYGSGKLVLFQIHYDKDWHAYELFFFVLLGIFGGAYGAYFSKLNYWWSKNVRNGTSLKRHPVLEVLLVTLLTTILCFTNPFTRMGGPELVYNLFAECEIGGRHHSGLCVVDPSSLASAWPIIKALLVALLVKGGLTVITFGIRLPAGVFVPTLGVGACAGRIIGILVQHVQYNHPNSPLFSGCNGDLDCVIPGLYAIVGAAAALAGATRTTVSLVVIVTELTASVTYAVPVMLGVMVAKTVADALEPKGIYDLVIHLNELPFLETKKDYVWGNSDLREVMDRDVDIIRADMKNTVWSLRDQLQRLVNSGHDDSGFPILHADRHDEGLRVLGYIGANELEHALSVVADNGNEEVHFPESSTQHDQEASLASLIEGEGASPINPFDFSVYMDRAPLTVQSNSPLELLHQMFVKLGARFIMITDPEGLYEGVIDKKTWLAFLEHQDLGRF